MGCLPYRHFQKSKTFRTSSCRSTDSRVGALTADWEVLAHGQLLRGPSRTGIQGIEREDGPRQVSLEVMLRGTCKILASPAPMANRLTNEDAPPSARPFSSTTWSVKWGVFSHLQSKMFRGAGNGRDRTPAPAADSDQPAPAEPHFQEQSHPPFPKRRDSWNAPAKRAGWSGSRTRLARLRS